MAQLVQCNRCKNTAKWEGKYLPNGFSELGEYHLCDPCEASFYQWLEGNPVQGITLPVEGGTGR